MVVGDAAARADLLLRLAPVPLGGAGVLGAPTIPIAVAHGRAAVARLPSAAWGSPDVPLAAVTVPLASGVESVVQRTRVLPVAGADAGVADVLRTLVPAVTLGTVPSSPSPLVRGEGVHSLIC